MTENDSCGRCGISLAMAIGDPGNERCIGCGTRVNIQSLSGTGAKSLSAFDSDAPAQIELLARTPAFAERYQLGRMLGRGAAALVFEATHIQMGRQVAIKFLCQFQEEEELERFRAEARTLASIRHGNVIQLFDFDHLKKHPYLVVELLTGGTLRARLVSEGALTPLMSVSVFAGCLNGLAACHSNGIIHRDLKPENVLFDGNQRPRIADFGIAKLIGQQSMTRTGEIIGTPLYMSPEQVRGEEAGAPSDLYAAGLMLYEMLSGRHPFQAETAAQVFMMHLEEPVVPLSVDGVPPALNDLIMSLLAKRAVDRPASVREVIETLKGCVRQIQRKEMSRSRFARPPPGGSGSHARVTATNAGNQRGSRVLNALTHATLQATDRGPAGSGAIMPHSTLIVSASAAGVPRPTHSRVQSITAAPSYSGAGAARIPSGGSSGHGSGFPGMPARFHSPLVIRTLIVTLLMAVLGPMAVLFVLAPVDDGMNLSRALPRMDKDTSMPVKVSPSLAQKTSRLSAIRPGLQMQLDGLWGRWTRRGLTRELMHRAADQLIQKGTLAGEGFTAAFNRTTPGDIDIKATLQSAPAALEAERLDGRTLAAIVRQLEGEIPVDSAELSLFVSAQGLSFCIWSSTEMLMRINQLVANVTTLVHGDAESSIRLRPVWEGPYPSSGLQVFQSYLADTTRILRMCAANPEKSKEAGPSLRFLTHIANCFRHTFWRDVDHTRVSSSIHVFRESMEHLALPAGPCLGALAAALWDEYALDGTTRSTQTTRTLRALRAVEETIPRMSTELDDLEHAIRQTDPHPSGTPN